ncbi:MAG: hypothetical protein R3E04_07110 [Sphingobium sp.]
MPLSLEPSYIRTRIERCRALADRARAPEIKNIHLAHLEHYQRMLEVSHRHCALI